MRPPRTFWLTSPVSVLKKGRTCTTVHKFLACQKLNARGSFAPELCAAFEAVARMSAGY